MPFLISIRDGNFLRVTCRVRNRRILTIQNGREIAPLTLGMTRIPSMRLYRTAEVNDMNIRASAGTENIQTAGKRERRKSLSRIRRIKTGRTFLGEWRIYGQI